MANQSETFSFFVTPLQALPSPHILASKTSLLTHTVAHSTRSSFRLKTNNQPLKTFLILSVS